MAEMKHTPGPWETGDSVFNPYPGHGQQGEADIYAPAEGGKRYIVATTVNTENGKPENAANAALIAAAPDLLAALTSLNHMGGDERGGYCICPRKDGSAPDSEHSSGCAKARAAIAKATP